MNTFKKIAAVTMAAATLATTMITAGASWRPYYESVNVIKVGDLNPTYSASKAVTISETQFESYCYNDVDYSYVSKKLSQGNILLSINTAANLGTEAGSNSIEWMLESLNLMYGNKPVLKDKYPLEVTMGGRNKVNVIAGSNNVFNYLDITSASIDSHNGSSCRNCNYDLHGCMWLKLDFEIEGYDYCVLPNFNINIDGLENPIEFTEYDFMDWNYYADGPVTKGSVTICIPKYSSYKTSAKTVDATINGVRVAKLELPKFDSVGWRATKVNYTNY